MKPTIIFVSGQPASGKTTLARAIADGLSLPFLSKDETLKEPMFDVLETTSRDWSIKIGKVSYQIMQNLIEQQLRAGYSMVVESTFKYEFDNPLFMSLQETYGFTAVQIMCHAQPEVLARRFMARIENGDRHPGHGHEDEGLSFEKLIEVYAQSETKPQAFTLNGKVIEIDTSDFAQVDTNQITRDIQSHMGTCE